MRLRGVERDQGGLSGILSPCVVVVSVVGKVLSFVVVFVRFWGGWGLCRLNGW